MIQSEYEFTFPVNGKRCFWKPLSVQKSHDITAAHRRPETQHLLSTSLLLARIEKYDGVPGPPSMAIWGEWEEFDLEAFAEEVAKVEESRKATFRKERLGGEARSTLKKVMYDCHAMLTQLSAAMNAVDEMMTAEELASPLKQPK